MVHKAEQYKAEGEVRRDRVAAKNFLEVHVFRVKSSSQEDSRREKIPEEDRCEEQDKCQEVLAWLEHNQLTGKECVHQKRALSRPAAPSSVGFTRGLMFLGVAVVGLKFARRGLVLAPSLGNLIE